MRNPQPAEYGLRPWSLNDTSSVLDAFATPDMARQGNIRRAAEAEDWVRYRLPTVEGLWSLADGGLERLELGHRVNNPASGAVARAAGFVHEGTERGKFLIGGSRIDVLTYGRLATDPIPGTPTCSIDPGPWA